MTEFDEIRVFPNRTPHTPVDQMACIGEPTERFMSLEKDREVLISVTYSWNVIDGLRLKKKWEKHFKNVRLGGPAISHYMDYNNGEFEPGKFIRPGPVFTSRGCIRHCSWCMVPRKEGRITPIKIREGFIIEDSNLFACHTDHIKNVMLMLSRQSHPAIFTGGIDARIFNETHLELLNTIRVSELYFAGDSMNILPDLTHIAELLSDSPASWKYTFCMIGFREDIHSAKKKIRAIRDIGLIPIPLLYQPYGKYFRFYSGEWLQLFYDNRPSTVLYEIMRGWYPEWENGIRGLNEPRQAR